MNVTDPGTETMLQMIKGYRISQVVGTLAELKIPDHLANGPLSPNELAHKSDATPKPSIVSCGHPQVSMSYRQ
jgi:hypothetical protein